MAEEQKQEETQEETKEESQPEMEQKTEEAPKEETKNEEKPEEPAKEEPKNEEKPEPSGKFKELIKSIESLSALELAELVKELEERFGVSAAAPVAVAGAPAGGAAPEAEEKSSYTVAIVTSGDQKINVIKAVREINPDLGLKEAKDLVDSAPKDIKKDIPKEEAEEAKKKLEEAGATVELK